MASPAEVWQAGLGQQPVELDEGIASSGSAGCRSFRASPREVEILRLIAEGFPDKWIGRELGISPHTVRSHLNRLYVRNNVHTRGAAIAAWYVKKAADRTPDT